MVIPVPISITTIAKVGIKFSPFSIYQAVKETQRNRLGVFDLAEIIAGGSKN